MKFRDEKNLLTAICQRENQKEREREREREEKRHIKRFAYLENSILLTKP
jgi:hypothetical protein